MNLSQLTTKVGHNLSKHSPAIFMGLSLAGVLTTAYLTHKAAQKATQTLSEVAGVTPKEKVQLTWKYYIPAALSCGATLGFIIAGNSVQYRRNAALVTAVTLGQEALVEYREQVVEQLGKGKDKKIRDGVNQKKISEKEKEGAFELLKAPNADNQEQYVYETESGRLLVSTVEKINKAANDVARECINNDYASLNMFYRLIGLPEVPMGETHGWNNTNPCEIDLGSAVVQDGKGMIAINYTNKPKVGFESFW